MQQASLTAVLCCSCLQISPSGSKVRLALLLPCLASCFPA
jgi:hypothetical protein